MKYNFEKEPFKKVWKTSTNVKLIRGIQVVI